MQKIRNIAIIAHVDHGKTTLVDKIMHHCQLFSKEHNELILDNNELERERGITIVSKNVSVRYKDVKINIIDTPGHADFGGEVERVLNMADGALVLVDAFEGPMPQTRYVLSKAIALGLKPCVVINKVDKENCKPDEVHEAMFDLMFNLGATEQQLDFPTVYGSAKFGWMSNDWKVQTDNVAALLDMVVEHVPAPVYNEGSLQMMVTSIDYSSYIGRIAIGRVVRGSVKPGQPVTLVKRDGTQVKSRIKDLFVFEGLGKAKAEEVQSGDIAAITGVEGFEIGDTIGDFDNPEALPGIPIDEPTMSMLFRSNDSPFFGREGKFVTSRHLRDRLYREIEKNLALRIEETNSADSFMVFGRGILHLGILVETMRREGYELQLGQPKVILKHIDGQRCEPIETLMVETTEESAGKVIEAVSQRKGEMVMMSTRGDRTHLEFNIPSRGIIGLRTNILNLTQGEAIMSHRFKAYEPWKGDIPSRINGVLIVHETGTSIAYALNKLQERGYFFIGPGEEVYQGQIIGENSRDNDMVVNATRTKKLTNMRASGSDDKVNLPPPHRMPLEEAMEYIDEDELVEVTPLNIRLRKIHLLEHERKKAGTMVEVDD
ncbi:MAG TPA: translational GTPase TypA [Chitinophagales bacterium]|nr:translational GTPase TypA [Chitinophagales bacterium]HMZ89066.1 translational GTPase TypA [Chitinophagales bacterium]HNE46835.1 translational GTPase TypA [Chitinophagales bacterium]HNF69515.1 translational GTPase TypA [Chitinophagales bacterium]HNI54483.1 translational GTPase TypA [Chitinophagales bacterium]